MKRICLSFIFLLFLSGINPLCAQKSDTVKRVVMDLSSNKNQKTKALIIGISDYQNIRSLQFADRDAGEFAEFLKTNDGWNVPDDNIMLMTNDNAKQGDILIGLQWLLDASEQGDDVLFYFSGHGDVETVGEAKKGYLLAHDSPKNNYPLGGTIAVQVLDSVFSELIRREVKVTVIIDACRSGNLAGGMTGKSQTTEALTQRWKNEIRILSAQPEQLSFEDKKWGGGRGVFSYYLVKGLSGHADMNGDLKIFLSELEQYIGNNIAIQTDYTQQPVLDGPNKFSTVISLKDKEQMAKYDSDVVEGEVNLTIASTKSGEELINSSCVHYADRINNVLESGLNADVFSNIEKEWKNLDSCTGSALPIQMRYKYMRSLINEINRVVQLTLTGEKLQIENDLKYGILLIEELEEINRGKNFVGKDHFDLVKDYFKSVKFAMYSDGFLSDEVYNYVISFDIPIDYYDLDGIQTLMYEYGLTEVKVLEYDTTIHPGKIVINTNLDWAMEALDVLNELEGKIQMHAIIYGDSLFIVERINPKGKSEKAINYWNYEKKYNSFLIRELEKDALREPDAAYISYAQALLYSTGHEKDSGMVMLQKAVEESPKWLMPRYLLGVANVDKHNYEEAIRHYEAILELDSIYLDFECTDCFYMGLLDLYFITDQKEKIDGVVQKWISFGSDKTTEAEAYKNMFGYASTKKEKQYWLDRISSLKVNTFEHQIDLIILNKQMNPRKFKEEKILEFIHEMINLEYKQEIEPFLTDPNIKRSDKTKSKIVRAFFPDGFVVTDYDRTEFYSKLEELLGAYMNGLIIKKQTLTEMFLLSGINRLESVENYAYWTDVMNLLINRTEDGDSPIEWMLRTENLDLDDGEQFMIDLFELDAENYKANYSKFYNQQFYESLYNLFDGIPFTQSEDYKIIKAKCSTFDEMEELKFIEKTMKRFIIEYY